MSATPLPKKASLPLNRTRSESSASVLPSELQEVRRRYPRIYVLVAPPRSSSTALSRVFWEHPSIAWYCHEPFEIAYFRSASLRQVADQLLEPLDLSSIKNQPADPGASSLVIKEMPYQVGEHFPLLAGLATAPLVFLLRDPRLNIASRMEKKEEVGDSPFFPQIETGWHLLERQIAHCREHEIPHVIVTAADFRGRPHELFPGLFSRLGLGFSPRMLAWRACAHVDIDNLEGDHSHLYSSVLGSTGLSPEIEPPPLDWFPCEHGLRDHVSECMEIYRELLALPQRLRPEAGIELRNAEGGLETSGAVGPTD